MRRSTTGVAALSIVAAFLAVTPLQVSAAEVDPPESGSPALSADGRWLAFISTSSDLLGGNGENDTNGVADAFLLDMQTGTIRLVSSPSSGGSANGPTTEVDVSGDGRYVAFASEATNLLTADANGVASDVFVLDTQTDVLSLASRRGAAGVQGNALSRGVSISDDGSTVAYISYATNLVGGDANNQPDAFVRDLVATSTTLVSTDPKGKQSSAATLKAAISGNGSIVAFQNTAGLVRQDTNGRRDVYVKTLATDKTQLVSFTNGEKPGNLDSTLADLSRTGRFVVFTSNAYNLVTGDTNHVADAFIRDRTAGTTVRVSRRGSTEANGPSYEVAISPDGAYVTFSTEATNLGGVETDENGTALDMFEFEVATKILRRVALDTTGGWANGDTFDPTYGSPSVIAFTSWATDLAASDADVDADVYTRRYTENRDQAGTTTHRSVPAPTA